MKNLSTRRHFLFFTLVVAAAVGLFHNLGTEIGLYNHFNWFDLLTHFLGGLWVGVATIWFFFVSGIFGEARPKKRAILVTVLIVIFAVGISWEVFEVLIGSLVETDYVKDTIIDLVMDTLGALAGYTYFVRKYLDRADRKKNV